ncbi:MAG TPA: autotransporter-associated beta strand repeat-containing protein [Chthoniobacteraceae bacterium]|nr:autotransporter-associated beta strand repeat-containing protein [Chthoniobacteraceae bacterium]
MKTSPIRPSRPSRKPSVPATAIVPHTSHRLLRLGATSILTTTLLATAPLTFANQLLVDGVTETISTAISYDGEGYPADDPNAGSAHRNAVLILNDGVLNLENGADLSVKNDDNNTAFLRVGYGSEQSGTLNIGIGAQLSVGQESRYANFHVADGAGTTGGVNQTGGQVTVRGSLNVGVDGGSGTYTISNGTLTLDHADDAGHTSLITLGLNLNAAGENAGTSTGTLVINGGRVEVLAPHQVGEATGSTEFILGNRDRGAETYGEGNGIIEQNAGTFSVGAGTHLYLSSVGNGAYHLNGGTLEIGGNGLRAKYGNGPGTYEFNLGGGTVQVTGSDLNTAVDATLVNGTTSTIDTNGLDATWSGDLTGTGVFVKKGDGKATLSGDNAFGKLSVEEGEATNGTGITTVALLDVGAGGTTGSYEISAGTVNVINDTNSAELTVGGGEGGNGRLDISGGTLNVGREGSFGRFFVGAYDGEGEVHQSGGEVNTSGPVNFGNRGGKGTYHLSGGTLNVGQYPASGDSNALILGRSRLGQQTGDSEGRINVSGDGRLVLNTNTPLLVGGDSDSEASMSSGYVTQTGGSVEVDSWIDLGSKGYGQYDLNDGQLEIGGANGLRSSSGDYLFNFGGGTLKVRGSNLTTSIDVTLVDGTASTIDTNGLDARFAGALTGDGVFHKTGDGVLTLAGGGDIGTDTTVTLIDEGEVVLEDNRLDLRGRLAVEDGAKLTINHELHTYSGTTAVAEPLTGVSIGYGSEGSLELDGDLVVHLEEKTSRITIGRTDTGGNGGTGSVIMTGGNLRVDETEKVGNPYVSLDVGRGAGSTGTFTQSGGAVNLKGGALQIGVEGGNGSYIMSDTAQLQLETGSTIYIGNGTDGEGLVSVTGNAQFIQGTTAALAGQIFLGSENGVGKIVQDGADTMVSIVTSNQVHIGKSGGSGTYELKSGTLTLGGNSGTAVGEDAGASGEIVQDEGALYAVGAFTVGKGGTGTYTIRDGNAFFEDGIVIAQQSGSTGNVELLGGNIEVGSNGIRKGSGTAGLLLGGATIKALADLTLDPDTTFQASTNTTLDTNGHHATLSGALAGSGTLTKSGTGTLHLASDDNGHTGATVVSGGTLSVDTSTGSDTVTVNAGATLTGTGAVRGFADVSGTLDVGQGLTFEQGLLLQAGSSTLLDIGGAGAGDYSILNLEGGAFTLGGTLTLNFTSFLGGSTLLNLYDLSESTVLSGNFASVSITGVYGTGLFTFADDLWSLERESGSVFTFDHTTGALAVPEPGTYIFVLGSAAAAWLLRRRNRLKTAA